MGLRNELTPQQEDDLLEQAREDNRKPEEIDMERRQLLEHEGAEDMKCPICSSVGKGEVMTFSDEGCPCKVYACECGHEEVLE